ncbi:RNA polymerase sigma factor [Merdibacter massiliensis]|uniref:RNA polymerase sigma factor n=1 Tax=Merdibacter massiliensis TaxID=1871030 RepID=UPI00096A3F5B|nr:RNA polymerase sigma factor [Merdibacter massiliensis]
MNEKTLIKALRKGNEAAVQQLVQHYYPPLYRYVTTKVVNQADAQDILQETFLRFMKQIPTYRVQGKLLGYLYVIASSCCIDHLRKEQRHRHLPIEEELLPNGCSFQEAMMQSFEYEHLHQLIVLLPNEEQDIIYFYYLKQMNFREISELLGIPQSTLKSRHARALIHLRNLWKEDNSNETME